MIAREKSIDLRETSDSPYSIHALLRFPSIVLPHSHLPRCFIQQLTAVAATSPMDSTWFAL